LQWTRSCPNKNSSFPPGSTCFQSLWFFRGSRCEAAYSAKDVPYLLGYRNAKLGCRETANSKDGIFRTPHSDFEISKSGVTARRALTIFGVLRRVSVKSRSDKTSYAAGLDQPYDQNSRFSALFAESLSSAFFDFQIELARFFGLIIESLPFQRQHLPLSIQGALFFRQFPSFLGDLLLLL
jgi:hypothetical protein